MAYVPQQDKVTIEILSSLKVGLMHAQLAGEMAAVRAAINLWYIEEGRTRYSVAELDEILEPMSVADRACEAAWAAFDSGDGQRTGIGSAELIAAQERMVAVVWELLPPEYRPHPPARELRPVTG